MIKNKFAHFPAGKLNKDEYDKIKSDLIRYISLNKGNNPIDKHKIHLLIPSIYELSTNKDILKKVEKFTKSKCVLWYSVLFNKEKKTDKYVPWHYDDYFWNLKGKGCTVWIPLEDIKLNMGPMEFAFDKKIKYIKHEVNKDKNNILIRGNTTSYKPNKNVKIKKVLIKQREFSIHSNKVMHRSGINRSKEDRLAIALRYIEINAKPSSMKYLRRGVVSKYKLKNKFYLEKKPNKITKSLGNLEHTQSVIRSALMTFFGDNKRKISEKLSDLFNFFFSKKFIYIFFKR
jgi:hypothetical protein